MKEQKSQMSAERKVLKDPTKEISIDTQMGSLVNLSEFFQFSFDRNLSVSSSPSFAVNNMMDLPLTFKCFCK